ncbi:hypothetical protein CH63R_13440 [Colletotrichum higginsianum IMI 349063]|uniref:Uncharacterized protein n=1 Tax=Colletotrichum higginsianum (strain IMI 349063) TaxID=759273 RepID=A0A1B7XX12_COLHI|nr:hypothetical protein CH63R_13440 [Colletotrichum higginsianum IMI 349063]OBR04313.1 hypothetical protein CH63R_13440 [Colletotrichum higginsianum IMI 349063]
MYMVSVTGDSGGSDDAVEAIDTIRGLVAIVAARGFVKIMAILASTFGQQGHGQIDIPEVMLVGGVKNQAVTKHLRGAYVVVRDDLPINKCTNPNNAWDADKSRCLEILAWYPKKVFQTLGGNKNMKALWTTWKMDKLQTLRNAIDCWKYNDGYIGKTDIREGD